MAALTYAHAGVLPNRPHDYLYDSTYTVAGLSDHLKAMNKSQAQQVIIHPTFNNMFSALRHYPPMRYQLKINPFPKGYGEDRSQVVEPTNVAGQNRFKYFRRPVMPYLPIFGGQIIYSKQKTVAHAGPSLPEPIQKSKTVGTQTKYRESQAQTDPYSPDYIFKPNEPPPELLALSSLSHGNGLPTGVAELEMIERARVKRIWEAQLPVAVDQESFERRLKMMEEMELKEWQERENEIKKLQDERLEILTQVVRKREMENDLENDKRLRKLQEQRNRVDQKLEKRDIINEYGNFGSKVYAPKARDGVFKDKASTTLQIRLTEMDTLSGLIELEATLPKSVLEPQIERIETKERSVDARREQQLKEQLENMAIKLQERKTRDLMDKEPLKYAIRIEKPPPRPPTPSITFPTEEEEEMEIAAHLLQKVINGRFVQTQMYESKQRQLNLINELRQKHTSEIPKSTQPDPADNRFESTIQAEYIGKTLDFLTKELVRKREQIRHQAMVKLASRTRLIREVEESGKRQLELLERSLETEIYNQITKVNQDTIDSYLQDIVTSSIQDTSTMHALEQIKIFANQPVLQTEMVVQDLMTTFLIPYIEKTILRDKIEYEQSKDLMAAHASIWSNLESVEGKVPRNESPAVEEESEAEI
ncbi:Cilia- and flagella-associated protein 91 [Terramyces sp. JEL0728]|nr:Cilia- and flagella-associated protein 91 [Terramyces sp. JEL0728]